MVAEPRFITSGATKKDNRRKRTFMTQASSLTQKSALQIFAKDTLVKGQPAKLECIEIGGQTYSVAKGPLSVMRLEDEWYEAVRDPEAVVRILESSTGFKPDLFTFRQHLPETEPKYKFYRVWESIAALPVKSFDHWWNKQVKGTTRNMIRKSQKAGVEVRLGSYDHDFVRGMTEIFNEAPIRQGRRFWHYGKDFETVKRQFSRFIFREEVIGAYYQGEMVGFAMVGNAGKFGDLGQIIAKIKHRDKAITNALVAKAVEVCEQKKLPYLVYAFWGEDSLSDFKRHSGFEEARLPRYFVPLTAKGKLALKLGLHRGWRATLPDRIKSPLKKLRKSWHGFRAE